jgi:Lar family restriction alleviation protein
MENELKPCPFCGSGAVMETFTTAMEKEPRYRVRCSGCWCETDWDNWSEEEAADKWNRRVNDG